ncbi:MAG: galactokinase [Gaiellaceae bacterium]
MVRTRVFAPARVNLIGEHTDYSGGLVLPVAVDLGLTVTATTCAEAIRLHSEALSDTIEIGADGTSPASLDGWGRYVAGMARLLAQRGRPPIGIEGTISSTLPIGAGMSSSAALTVSVGLGLCRVAEFELAPLELARTAQEAEHVAVGVPCGLMDPATSLLGRRGHALFLDCGSELYRHVALPAGIAIVVLDSGVRHKLEDSGYATRRSELERGLDAIGAPRPSALTTEKALELARAAHVDEVATRRLRHVVSENERVRRCVALLESPSGIDLSALGDLFREGQTSLRDDFEISTPELDLLVDLAYANGAIAARMTGGGFGGSVVALIAADVAEEVSAATTRAYAARTGLPAASYVCTSVDGAGELPAVEA